MGVGVFVFVFSMVHCCAPTRRCSRRGRRCAGGGILPAGVVAARLQARPNEAPRQLVAASRCWVVPIAYATVPPYHPPTHPTNQPIPPRPRPAGRQAGAFRRAAGAARPHRSQVHGHAADCAAAFQLHLRPAPSPGATHGGPGPPDAVRSGRVRAHQTWGLFSVTFLGVGAPSLRFRVPRTFASARL